MRKINLTVLSILFLALGCDKSTDTIEPINDGGDSPEDEVSKDPSYIETIVFNPSTSGPFQIQGLDASNGHQYFIYDQSVWRIAPETDNSTPGAHCRGQPRLACYAKSNG
ncbi:hypothetical protein D2V08_03405 [Flagellimonas lutimaris]|uniref:Uncharacterized protein n=1 Tax=Flagellimonas lutimaris TaxID=475082 RepID=A0A3A1NAU7_9FLAO|nr:hypothetical protein [Allomuricauda lutimaris]RIV36006.1 hypothetical protein D2V08_03405 [Allomuricauda lutimaris]